MLTFFTSPKPIIGHNAIIQKNALRSWRNLSSEIEIIVFGEGEGIAELCEEINGTHIKEVLSLSLCSILIFQASQIDMSIALLPFSINYQINYSENNWKKN